MENKFSIFARNLDDAELCLPPHVFFKNVPSRFNPHHHHPPLSCMDDLAQCLAALSLPKHMHKPPEPTNFERLREPVRYGSMNRTVSGVSESLYEFTTGSFLGGTEPVHEVQFLKPTQATLRYFSVESYVEARARDLRRQQNRLVQNRVLQFKANGLSNSKRLGAGLGRESGGTGVFHPRIVSTNNPSGTVFDSKKKPNSLTGLRNRQISLKEIEVSSGKMKSIERINVAGKQQQEECYYRLPLEMDLPRDWTY